MRASSRLRSTPRCRCSRWRCALRVAAGGSWMPASAKTRVSWAISCACWASRRWMPRCISSAWCRPVPRGAGAWPNNRANASPRRWQIAPHESAARKGLPASAAAAQWTRADHAVLQRRPAPAAATRGKDGTAGCRAGGGRWRRRCAPHRGVHRAARRVDIARTRRAVPRLGRQRRFHLCAADRQSAARRRLGHLPAQLPRPRRQPWAQRGAVPLLPYRRGGACAGRHRAALADAADGAGRVLAGRKLRPARGDADVARGHSAGLRAGRLPDHRPGGGIVLAGRIRAMVLPGLLHAQVAPLAAGQAAGIPATPLFRDVGIEAAPARPDRGAGTAAYRFLVAAAVSGRLFGSRRRDAGHADPGDHPHREGRPGDPGRQFRDAGAAAERGAGPRALRRPLRLHPRLGHDQLHRRLHRRALQRAGRRGVADRLSRRPGASGSRQRSHGVARILPRTSQGAAMHQSGNTVIPHPARRWALMCGLAWLFLPAPAAATPEATLFRSFEAAEPAPPTSPANAPFGIDVAGGPNAAAALDAKPGVGFSGLHSLHYRGDAGGRQEVVLFAANLPVRADTRLSYLIFPCSNAGDLRNPANYVAVDLQFDDGSHLSTRGAVDQHRIGISAHAQGEGRTLYPDQWNFLSVDLGRVAAGRTIKRILLIHDGPAVRFQGYLDDLRVGPAPADTRQRPSDFVDTRRGSNSDGRFSRGNTFPAVAMPHGFNFWTPVTDAGSDWIYQYQQRNGADNRPRLEAFALSHEPSPWMGDRQTFQLMPASV